MVLARVDPSWLDTRRSYALLAADGAGHLGRGYHQLFHVQRLPLTGRGRTHTVAVRPPADLHSQASARTSASLGA
jgi:hypothetical protein